jgi:rubrerythrin
MAILRLAIIAEYDAASLYEKMAEETSDKNIKKVLLEVANEEKAHIGEFEFLLEHVDPEHETNEEKGEEEVMDLTGLDAPPNE